MATETYLIQRSDFTNYWPLSSDIDDVTVEASILRVQRGHIRDAVGKALYYDLTANATASKYVTLLNGGTYTYCGNTANFFGLRAAIVCYCYADILQYRLRATRSGAKIKEASESVTASYAEIAREAQIAEGQGFSLIRECQEFLSQNKSTYPLYSPDARPRGAIRTGVGVQPDNYSENDSRIIYPRYV